MVRSSQKNRTGRRSKEEAKEIKSNHLMTRSSIDPDLGLHEKKEKSRPAWLSVSWPGVCECPSVVGRRASKWMGWMDAWLWLAVGTRFSVHQLIFACRNNNASSNRDLGPGAMTAQQQHSTARQDWREGWVSPGYQVGWSWAVRFGDVTLSSPCDPVRLGTSPVEEKKYPSRAPHLSSHILVPASAPCLLHRHRLSQ